jgi:hypothetical protein
MLIKRVYEVDPLACPACGAEMRVISFIGPPQEAVAQVEKSLKGKPVDTEEVTVVLE